MNAFASIVIRSLRIGMPILCAGLCMVSVVGCTTSKDASFSYSAKADYADEAFDYGSRRAPLPETIYRTARLLAARGMTDAAYSTLTNLIEQHPNYVPAYVELASLQVRQRRVAAAIRTLEAGIAIDGEDAVLHNNLGMCAMLMGNYERALEAFDAAAVNDEENARYRSNKALALAMLGHYDAALAIYQQVETAANAHYNLAVVCEARADFDRAEQEFAKAYELNPSLEHSPGAQ